MLGIYDPSLIALILISLSLSLGMLYLVTRLLHLKAHLLFIIILGSISGLIIGALASIPLSKLPNPYGEWLPLIVTLLLTILTISTLLRRSEGFSQFFRNLPHYLVGLVGLGDKDREDSSTRRILVDTSAIIDGRLYEVAKAGFIPGRLVVPRFVIGELQALSDSSDTKKRTRGRRGLEILSNLRKEFKLELSSEDLPELNDVDSKLAGLAVQSHSELMTTDYNLAQVASVEGVKVLNLNELSGLLRPVVLPGEELEVEIGRASCRERG